MLVVNKMKKIKLTKVEIKVEEELIRNLKKNKYTVEKALEKILHKSLWKFSNKLEKNKCPICGKPTDNTLTIYEVTALNRGLKTRKELGICDCEKNKMEKPHEEKEKFNPFEGKRYQDYDDEFMKKTIFKNKKLVRCDSCPNLVSFIKSYFGFNKLLCKGCYIKLSKSNHKAVEKMVNRL